MKYKPLLVKIMRITFLQLAIVLSIVGSSLAKNGKAQAVLKTKISINETGTELGVVLSKLEKNYDINFVYSPQLVDVKQKINVFTQMRPLSEILDQILTPLKLTYEASGDVIVIRNLNITASQTGQINTAPQIMVTGKVVDEKKGEPLPGVTIKIKGTTTAVSTNSNGVFSISVPNAESVLVFSFIGYDNEERVVGNTTIINVVMKENQHNLSEVLVVGYGTQKKSDITGSVVRADLDSFRQSPDVNVLQLLQGAVPGLNIGQVTSAGQTPSIQVRGQSTISGSTGVLIVLDGIVYAGDLSRLNPNDIASIDILKDASSKAIYGASAANGVMLITSKKGKKGDKPVINFSTSYASQNPAQVLHPLDRNEFIQKVKDILWQQAYLAPDYLTPNPAFNVRSKLDATQVAGYDDGTDFDWYGAATQPGFIFDNQLSVSNATDKTNFYVSGGYTKQTGFVINDQFIRKSVRVNLETKVFNWLSIGTQTFATLNDYSGTSPDLRSIQLYSPLNTPFSSSGSINLTPNGSINNPFLGTYGNDFDHRNTISGNFYGILNIPGVDGLSYRVNFGNNYYWNQRYTANQYSANFTGAVGKSNDDTYDYSIDNILNYNRTFNQVHKIDLTLVYGARQLEFQSTNATGTGYNNIALGYNSIQQGLILKNTSNAYSDEYNYQTGRLNYGYKSKYLLTATIRRDGYSGFAANKKFGLFPSVAAAWVASNESFFKLTWVDDLKLRAGYGSNGNLTNRYASLATVSQGAAYVFGDNGATLFGQQVTSLSNSDLSWETTTGINVGVDFSFLKGRISGTVDWYNTNTNDLLFNVKIPTITGFGSINTNVGKLNNTGTEITLNTVNVRLKDFQWKSTINFASNKNKVVALTGSGDLVTSNLFIGQPLGAIYNYQTNGMWQIGETPIAGFYVGGNKVVDQNGDGKITSDDRVILGHTEPAYRFSVGNTFSYKQLSLFAFINSVQGGNNGYLGYNNPWSDLGIQQGDNAIRNNWFSGTDYWSPRNPGATYRVTGSVPATDPGLYQNRSFIRLQEVSLSYDFSTKLTTKLGLKNLRLYISGKNLATWTKWTGWDPESIQGLAYGAAPVIKAYAIGLNVTL
ncbi:TonB-linked SusC/RagA family outer membrane protein [Mucilaginibacter yixingensis]|uniref:TonB-linked SusC/RagA family outer membrane protein n=1 Tax=Mucilaginibacter yixingensis TaxID=1295612 RepID=A0A2T5J4E7_9SPHI|nr:TonB-dependent receptor [Mucilaginibacter yixingensis]PTQ92268.1 TonB-linked SusC/RagA family outer membrane protein [Mucilaginibacter yixingensis]